VFRRDIGEKALTVTEQKIQKSYIRKNHKSVGLIAARVSFTFAPRNNIKPMNAQTTESGNLSHVLEQTGFWLKIVEGWKREIGRVVERSEKVNASPEVTAKVALTAGELSVFADQLEELYNQIGYLKLQIPSEESDEKHVNYYDVNRKLHSEGQRFRDLLSEMFKLDKAAYRRFLC
jgi:hypothetical protein